MNRRLMQKLAKACEMDDMATEEKMAKVLSESKERREELHKFLTPEEMAFFRVGMAATKQATLAMQKAAGKKRGLDINLVQESLDEAVKENDLALSVSIGFLVANTLMGMAQMRGTVPDDRGNSEEEFWNELHGRCDCTGCKVINEVREQCNKTPELAFKKPYRGGWIETGIEDRVKEIFDND